MLQTKHRPAKPANPAFNHKYARTGTLWEGRFRSCLVDSDRYLLTYMRYIEINPMRAGLAALPWDYRWSSVRANLGLQPCLREPKSLTT